MTYSRESHELLEATLTQMVAKYGQSTAYAKMLGYLIVNVPLEESRRIAEHENEKVGV
jgi:hypothetical protein